MRVLFVTIIVLIAAPSGALMACINLIVLIGRLT